MNTIDQHGNVINESNESESNEFYEGLATAGYWVAEQTVRVSGACVKTAAATGAVAVLCAQRAPAQARMSYKDTKAKLSRIPL